jgi:hypothetical protein
LVTIAESTDNIRLRDMGCVFFAGAVFCAVAADVITQTTHREIKKCLIFVDLLKFKYNTKLLFMVLQQLPVFAGTLKLINW